MTDLFQRLTEQVFRTADVAKPRLPTRFGPATDLAVGMPDYPGQRSQLPNVLSDLVTPSDAQDIRLPSSFVPQVNLPADAPVPSLRQLRTALTLAPDDAKVNAVIEPVQEGIFGHDDDQELTSVPAPQTTSDAMDTEEDQTPRLMTAVEPVSIDQVRAPSGMDELPFSPSHPASADDEATDAERGATIAVQSTVSEAGSHSEQSATKSANPQTVIDQTIDAAPMESAKQPEPSRLRQPAPKEVARSSSSADSVDFELQRTELRQERIHPTIANTRPLAAVDDDQEVGGQVGNDDDLRIQHDESSKRLPVEDGRSRLLAQLDAEESVSSVQRAFDGVPESPHLRPTQSSAALRLPPASGTELPEVLPHGVADKEISADAIAGLDSSRSRSQVRPSDSLSQRASDERVTPMQPDSLSGRLSEESEDLTSQSFMSTALPSTSPPRESREQPARLHPSDENAGSLGENEQVGEWSLSPSVTPNVQDASPKESAEVANAPVLPDGEPQRAQPIMDRNDIQRTPIEPASSVRETESESSLIQAVPSIVEAADAGAVEKIAASLAAESLRTYTTQSTPILKSADALSMNLDTAATPEREAHVGEVAPQQGSRGPSVSIESGRMVEPTATKPQAEQGRSDVTPQPDQQSPSPASARLAEPAAPFALSGHDAHHIATSASSDDKRTESARESMVQPVVDPPDMTSVDSDAMKMVEASTEANISDGGPTASDDSSPVSISSLSGPTPTVLPVSASNLLGDRGGDAGSTANRESGAPSASHLAAPKSADQDATNIASVVNQQRLASSMASDNSDPAGIPSRPGPTPTVSPASYMATPNRSAQDTMEIASAPIRPRAASNLASDSPASTASPLVQRQEQDMRPVAQLSRPTADQHIATPPSRVSAPNSVPNMLQDESVTSHRDMHAKARIQSTAAPSPQRLSGSDPRQNNLTAELEPTPVAQSESSKTHVVDNFSVPVAPVQRSTREIQSNGEESSVQDYPGVELEPGSDVPTRGESAWNPNDAVRPQVSVAAAPNRESTPDVAAVTPTVRVTIGRVEVRTKATEKPPVSVRRSPAKPALSLDAYLNGGQARNS